MFPAAGDLLYSYLPNELLRRFEEAFAARFAVYA
jgi:hypothetical protein